MTRCKPRNRCVFEVEHGFRAVMLDGGVEGWRADDDRKHRSEVIALPHGTDAVMVRAAFEAAGWVFQVSASGAVMARHRMQTRRRVVQAGGTLSSRRLREAVAGHLSEPEVRQRARRAATCAALGLPEAGAISLRDLLRWVFDVQLADVDRDDVGPNRAGFSLEYVILQRQRLGCSVDGASGSNPLHYDAERIVGLIERTFGRHRHLLAVLGGWVSHGLPAWHPTPVGGRHGRGAGQRAYIETWEVVAAFDLQIHAEQSRVAFQRYQPLPFDDPREPWRGVTRLQRDWPDTSRLARWGANVARGLAKCDKSANTENYPTKSTT